MPRTVASLKFEYGDDRGSPGWSLLTILFLLGNDSRALQICLHHFKEDEKKPKCSSYCPSPRIHGKQCVSSDRRTFLIGDQDIPLDFSILRIS